MDRILFSTLVGLFLACITAIMAFTKLINDKEGKTSEFRQEWTGSIRITLSDLFSNYWYLFYLYESAWATSNVCKKLSETINGEEEGSAKFIITKESLSHHAGILDSKNSEIMEVRRSIKKSYSLAQLHFKQNDCDFSKIENGNSLILRATSDLREKLSGDSGNTEVINFIAQKRSEVDLACNDMMHVSRSILKNEWERIKSGEGNYQTTKKLFKVGSGVMVAILAGLFILVTITRYSNYLAEQKIGQFISCEVQKCVEQKGVE